MPPGFLAASPMALAVWNFVYCSRSPSTPICVRLSSAASTSGGSEMFSMKNVVSARPICRQVGRDAFQGDLADAVVVAGQVEDGDLRLADGVDEARDDGVAQLGGDLVRLERRVGGDELLAGTWPGSVTWMA